MSSAADNALKQHIFDNEDGTGRLLRFRSGHAAPPHRLAFYGQEGRVILSAAGDHAVRVFSVIQDQQSREMTQVSPPLPLTVFTAFSLRLVQARGYVKKGMYH